MELRSAFRSPPVVAGFAVLAIMIGAAMGARAGLGDDTPDTQVAGVVVERSEPAVETEEPAGRDPIIVVRPAPPTEPVREPAPAPLAEEPTLVVEAPAEPVGLIRDEPAPVIADEPGPRPARQRTPPEPVDDATQPPRTPPPTQDPATTFALRAGAVDGIHTALATEGNWEIRQVSGHRNQTPEQQASRRAQDRMTAMFADSAFATDSPQRQFRCDVVIDAGSRRLIVDDNHHEFQISLWTATADGYSRDTLVDTRTVRTELDLAAGRTATLAGVARTLDAAENVDYTCRAEFVDLPG